MTVSNHESHCLVCNSVLVHKSTNKKKKFCSSKCKSKFHEANCYKSQVVRALERKQYFIDKAGGGCQVCGYNRSTAALSFHHKDPSTKSFCIDSRKLSNTSMEILEQEFTKCSLLCMNCHMELHYPNTLQH